MPLIYKSYKVELDPTNVQITRMKKNIGAARFAYNWGLSKKIEGSEQKIKRIIFTFLALNSSIIKKFKYK
jgi:transposase